MKIVTILGARPQFIKAWPVSHAFRESGYAEYVVHTGQHYDFEMCGIFYRDLDIPKPSINLEVGSASHGRQTGMMLERIEAVLEREDPDWVLVYGDTNSTLAGALAAVKLHLKVAHVEAGLRSFNRRMPEEHNRVLTDHCSDLLFCPTERAVANLKGEGIVQGVHLVGDVMYDALIGIKQNGAHESRMLETLCLKPKRFFLITIHRAENTDDPERLRGIMTAVTQLSKDEPVVFPMHPRTVNALKAANWNIDTCAGSQNGNLKLIEPVGYADMIQLEESARLILTDSGGVQKEAFWLKTPCVTLREETEWLETVELGWNRLAGSNPITIAEAVKKASEGRDDLQLRDEGAAKKVAQLLAQT